MNPLGSEPQWYRDAVIYQVHVRAFQDSDGDGIGDFRGLTERLDYIQDLGVTAIWLQPFYPSPLKDDGYDIAAHRDVHPSYGTLRDFRRFLRQAHARGLRVITELVLNHTSDQHPWFQRARRAKPGSCWRDWYVWSDTTERYRDARIIFGDFEPSNWSWDPVAGAYYWHRFYAQQPDLNFDNPDVRAELMKVIDFWFGLGVDGLRLDAVPYLFEAEGTNCENLPETHAFLKELRAHIDARFADRMLLAEANQWPEDAAAYFGDGDECHMNFHFPLMPRLFMALQREDRFPVIEILEQTPTPPPGCQWALFLRNHDELTLEMVTDEERDYMYRVYAQDRQARINLGIRRRLAPLLEHDRGKIELLTGLLLSLPGTPVIYYGDEIGMGDNVYLGDRNGVRTPMQWSADRNAGFSTANPQRLYLPVIIDPTCHHEAINVESQLATSTSLLWWTRRILALRKRHPVFGRGDIEFLHPDNHHVLAFLRGARLARRHDDEVVLVVANLSRHAQYVELDLSRFRGAQPVELFGQTSFPPISDRPYLVTLGPHGFYWMAVQSTKVRAPSSELKVLDLGEGRWATVFDPTGRDELAQAVRRFLPAQPWFDGGDRRLREVRMVDVAPLAVPGTEAAAVLVVDALFGAGEAQRYVVPAVVVSGDRAAELGRDHADGVIALVRRGPAGDTDPAVLVDGMVVPEVPEVLFDVLQRRRRVRARAGGVLRGVPGPWLRTLVTGNGEAPPSVPSPRFRRQTVSTVVGDRLVFKLFRRLSPGRNPEVELTQHLAAVDFPSAPRLGGAVEYDGGGPEPATVAVVRELVPSEGDEFTRSVDELGRRYEAAFGDGSATAGAPGRAELGNAGLWRAAGPSDGGAGPRVGDGVGDELHLVAELIGSRLGELHLALADDRGDPAFAPERFSQLDQRALYQALRNRAQAALQRLARAAPKLDDDGRPLAGVVAAGRDAVLDRLVLVHRRRLSSARIRVHGDLRLDRILWTGRDVVFFDFEGDASRPVTERRLKRSPYLDVAGLLRSFEDATWVARQGLLERGIVTPDVDGALTAVQRSWFVGAAGSFLRGYRRATAASACTAADDDEAVLLLDAFGLDLALGRMAEALDHRRDPVALTIALAAVARIAGLE